jgi:hypothetical protein
MRTPLILLSAKNHDANQRGDPAASYRWAGWNWKKPIKMKNFRIISDLFYRKLSIPSKNSRNNRMISINSQATMKMLGFWLNFTNFSWDTAWRLNKDTFFYWMPLNHKESQGVYYVHFRVMWYWCVTTVTSGWYMGGYLVKVDTVATS